jgi:hypothetical protein
MKEATARIKINKLLEAAGSRVPARTVAWKISGYTICGTHVRHGW